MIDEIKEDNNCIIKAFENNPISIITENKDNKKCYCFKASDIGKALGLVNIRSTIQNYDDDERVVHNVYDPQGTPQDTIFLTSQGVYRLLYNSKKDIAKKFRKWAGNILDDIIFNESKELKKQLDQKEQEVKELTNKVEKLEEKPSLQGFNDRKCGELYFVRDMSKPGYHIKIGVICTLDKDKHTSFVRVGQLNCGSSTSSLKLYTKFETFDIVLTEDVIHRILHPFKIISRKEWFYFNDELELAYAINTVKKTLKFINQFNIKNYKEFTEIISNINIEENLVNDETLQKINIENHEKIKQKDEKIKLANTHALQQRKVKTGIFKGVYFCQEKKLWSSRLQHDSKSRHLGYFTDEIDGAKVYNDYALFLNETENTNFLLNEIPGYKTIARNIPEINKKEINEQNSSKYKGVSYDKKRKYYVSGIQCNGKTCNLGSSLNELECAKWYNQQALFFNNTLNTTYILNDIPDYITIPKDIHTELLNKKKKTSKYYGVSISTAGKWACSYMLNRKKIHIGTYNTELEACEAYNKVVIELNKNGCKYKINKLS